MRYFEIRRVLRGAAVATALMTAAITFPRTTQGQQEPIQQGMEDVQQGAENVADEGSNWGWLGLLGLAGLLGLRRRDRADTYRADTTTRRP